jgi:hypothetical protein
VEQAAEGLASALGQRSLQLACAILLSIGAQLGLFHLRSAALGQESGNAQVVA